jgi:hypothetical protein
VARKSNPIQMLGEAQTNPAHRNPWEVRSDSGLEGVFADEDDARFYAEEIRGSGARGVSVDRRERGTRPSLPKRALQNPCCNPSSRLFAGVYPTGIAYADKERERDGDYLRVAFLPFSTLRLQWSPGNHPAELREEIEHDATQIIARRGQPFEVDASGQTVILGGEQRRQPGAPPQYHAPMGRPPGVPNRSNPAGLTAKGERMYQHIKESYGDDPRAAEIASRTVLSRRNPPNVLPVPGQAIRSWDHGAGHLMRICEEGTDGEYTATIKLANGTVASVPLKRTEYDFTARKNLERRTGFSRHEQFVGPPRPDRMPKGSPMPMLMPPEDIDDTIVEKRRTIVGKRRT